MNAIGPASAGIGYSSFTPPVGQNIGAQPVSSADQVDGVAPVGQPTQDQAGDPASSTDQRTTQQDPRQLTADKERQLAQAEAEQQRVLQAEIRELANRDREVRTHEQAHLAVGGQYAGPVSYEYERGPNGRLYAVGGSVAIDTAPVPGDPQATVEKMQQVQRAALAPAQPSAQDLAVAAQAAQAMAQANAELAVSALEERPGQTAETSDSEGRREQDLNLYREVGRALDVDDAAIDLLV